MESVEQTNGLKSRLERVFTSASHTGRVSVEGFLRSTATARTSIAAVIAPELAREAELSYIDPNTSLPNHRAMHRLFEQFLEIGQPFATIMVDIDKFKAVNEAIGHEYANGVLTQFAQGLQGVVRSGDALFFEGSTFRTGGDEFVILAPLQQRTDTELSTEERLDALLGRIRTEYLDTCQCIDPSGTTVLLSATAHGEVADPAGVADFDTVDFLNSISKQLLTQKNSRS